jgi:2-polyprenyl-3-methyl-5-hydroxy-6-metoxy-1,4-benzoquinol methylase
MTARPFDFVGVEVIRVGFEFNRFFSRMWWRYRWLYFRGLTPWDTSTTPPEVMEYIETARPGRALDLGCGTGTNAIELARQGWQVTGVDFVSKAIRTARAKAAGRGLNVDFHCTSVTRLDAVAGSYDYALDIGCLFALGFKEKRAYAAHLARLLRPGACYMLYAWYPRTWKGRRVGLADGDVDALLRPCFAREKMVAGEEKGFPSAWYWYRREQVPDAGKQRQAH